MRVFLVLLIFALLTSSNGAVARERLDLHLAFGTRTPLYGSLASRLVAEVQQRSGGALRLRPHEPDSLVPRFAYLDAVGQGSVDAAWGTPAVLSGRAPEAALFTGVPFGLDPAAHLAWVRDGPGRPLYDAMYDRFGVVGIPCAAVGPDGLAWLIRPLDETAPFRGLRVRAFGLPARVLGALGAASALGFGADLMIGLGTGSFDAAEAGVPAADVAIGLHTVASVYLYPSPLQPTTLLDLVVNRAHWERLGAAGQRILVEACRSTADFAREANEIQNRLALQTLAGSKLVIAEPTRATVAALRAGWTTVRDEQAAGSPAFAAVLDAYPGGER